MELKIIATYNQQHILTGITQVPKDAQLIDDKTETSVLVHSFSAESSN